MSHIPTLLYVRICMYVSMSIYISYMCACSVTQSSLTLCNPTDCGTPGFPAFTIYRSLLKLIECIIYFVTVSDHFVGAQHCWTVV